MSIKRIAVIAVKPINAEKGGAERFYQGLVKSLNQHYVETDFGGSSQ